MGFNSAFKGLKNSAFISEVMKLLPVQTLQWFLCVCSCDIRPNTHICERPRCKLAINLHASVRPACTTDCVDTLKAKTAENYPESLFVLFQYFKPKESWTVKSHLHAVNVFNIDRVQVPFFSDSN